MDGEVDGGLSWGDGCGRERLQLSLGGENGEAQQGAVEVPVEELDEAQEGRIRRRQWKE